MPEANISPPTDDETTGARAAAADGDGEPATSPAEGEKRAERSESSEQPVSRAPSEQGDGELGEQEEAGEYAEAGEQAHPAEVGDPDARPGLTPRQARRVRAIVSGIVMAAVAVALVVRLGSAPSVLTMGFYGIALILSGTAIALSRRGRTRVATGVLALGFAAVALAEWLLASVE
ncbi:hypothetical protein [Streptomyces winkii]|uniref:hypothetical protein n=1 Tax=Streptomyces winkii TaxID=3051178 RepID=UPI0028D54FE8|nr:hypothetical protein [Streptomyces sp. DSM 40971]